MSRCSIKEDFQGNLPVPCLLLDAQINPILTGNDKLEHIRQESTCEPEDTSDKIKFYLFILLKHFWLLVPLSQQGFE